MQTNREQKSHHTCSRHYFTRAQRSEKCSKNPGLGTAIFLSDSETPPSPTIHPSKTHYPSFRNNARRTGKTYLNCHRTASGRLLREDCPANHWGALRPSLARSTARPQHGARQEPTWGLPRGATPGPGPSPLLPLSASMHLLVPSAQNHSPVTLSVPVSQLFKGNCGDLPVVQRLRLRTVTAGGLAGPWLGELRSHRLHGSVKKNGIVT